MSLRRCQVDNAATARHVGRTSGDTTVLDNGHVLTAQSGTNDLVYDGKNEGMWDLAKTSGDTREADANVCV